MFKKLGLAIVFALAFCFISFAKTNVNLKTKYVTSDDVNEELVNKLASDADFVAYYNGLFNFSATLKKTNSLNLLKKYVAKNSSSTENGELFKHFNVANKAEFDAIAKGLIIHTKNFAPIINAQKLDEAIKKDILLKAFEKVRNSENFKKEHSYYPFDVCWDIYIICSTACFLAYPESSQYWDCLMLCVDAMIICSILSEA